MYSTCIWKDTHSEHEVKTGRLPSPINPKLNRAAISTLKILKKTKLLNRRRQWHPTPVLLPGKSMDRGAWWAAVHGVAKSRTRLSDFTFTFLFHALEKEMAAHSSVLAWRIPGTTAWWAAVYGVTQSRTRLKRLSSSSSSKLLNFTYWEITICQGL